MTQSDTSRYWHSEVSEITPETIFIRGYDLEDLIGTSFTSATFLMIRGRIPTPREAKVMDAILTAVLDYGLEKTGTAAARYVVSCNPSVQAGLAAAALSAGDYGLATENTARFIRDTYQRYVDAGSTDMVEFATQVVAEERAAKRRIPGLGHPVFKHVDPRAEILKQIALENGLWGPAAELYEAVHREFIKLPGREEFPINDVAMLAVLCVAMGFTPEESTALAIFGTMPGVIAHISEELASKKYGRLIPAETADYDVPRRSYDEDSRAAGWEGMSR